MKRIYTLFAVLLYLLPVLPLASQSTNPADWVFDKGVYSTNMVLTAVVSVEGKESRDTSDRVAAFVGSEVRGVGKPVYVPELDRYLVNLLIYGDGSPSQITFLVYDGGTQRVLPVLDTIAYQDTPLGSPANPFVLRTVQIDISFLRDDVLCATDTFGYAAAKITGGKKPYTYLWSTGDTTDSIGNLSAGRYYLTVTDANNIDKVDSVDIVNLQKDIEEPIVRVAPDTAICAENNVYFFARTNEIDSPLYYRWYDIFGTLIHTGEFLELPKLTASTEVSVQTELRTCLSERVPASVRVYPLPEAGFSVSERVVREKQLVSFRPTVNEPSWKYLWDFGDGETSDSILASHQYAIRGFYEVSLTVTSPEGCTATSRLTLRVEEGLAILLTDSPPACPTDSTGILVAQVFNGAPPFKFVWNTGDTTAELRGLFPGFYRVTVTDDEGREGVAEIDLKSKVLELEAPEVVINGNLSYCPGDDLQITAFSPIAEAEFWWYNAVGERIFSGNPLIIFNAEAGQTLYVETRLGQCVSPTRTRVEVPVYEPYASFSYFAVNFPTPVNPDFVNAGEELVFSPDSIVSGYRYDWQFGDGRRVIIDASSVGRPPVVVSPVIRHTYADTGTYVVKLKVTTPKGCTREFERIVKVVRLRILFTKDDAYCEADTFAWVKARVEGGRPPYQLEWSTGSRVDSIFHLGVGRYSLKVTDATGFSLQTSVDIINRQVDIEEPRISAAPGQAICVGSEAFLFAQVPPQSEPTKFFWYNVLNNPMGEGRVLNLGKVVSPTLIFAQTEVRGCRSERITYTVDVLETPNAAFSVTERVPRVGQEVGFFPAQINSRYSYNWSFGDGTISNGSLPSHAYALEGFYEVKLELIAPGGCRDEYRKTLRVEEEDAIIIVDEDLIVLLDVTNVACLADETGVIRAQVLEGTPPFTYRWSNGATTSSIRRLRAGRYTLTVTDSQGLSITAQANVEVENEEIPLPEVIVNSGQSICAGEDVLLVASAGLDGAGFYWYSEAEGGEPIHIGNEFWVRNLQSAATYYVETRSGVCASAERRAVVLQPRRPDANFTVSAFRLQLGEALQVSINRPIAQNRYYWDFGNGHRDTSASPLVYQYPQAGEYRLSLTVEEPGGCRHTQEVTILIVTEGLSLFFEVEHPNCPDDASGIIIAQVIGGQSPYTYQWSTGQRTAALNGLRAGAYRLTVTDAGGRSVSGNVVLNSRVQEIPAAQVVVNGGQPYCPGDDILLTAFAPGLAGAEFYWYDGSNPSRLLYAGSPLIQFSVEENRSFLVETRLGACTAATRTLVEVPVSGPDAGFDVTARRVSPETEIEFTPRTIDSDNNYLWDFGDGTRATVPVTTHAYTDPGAYVVTLTVTDPNGCSSEFALTIEVDAPGVLFSAFEVKDVNCINDRDGSILVNAINGVAPYTYQWSNGQTGNSLSGLARGKYYLTITDASSQRLVDSVEIKSRVGEVLPANAVSATGDTVCVGREVVLLAYSQQSGPLSFYWYDAPQGGNLIQQTNQLQISSLKENRELFLETRIGSCIAPNRTSVRVWVDNPNQGFSVDERFVLMGKPVRFTPVVNDPLNQYQWFFGDGGNGREPEATHIYEQPGSYDVQLIVISPRGCVGLSSSESLVTVLADTDFTATLDIQQVSCSGKTDGRIRAQAFNGTSPYSFEWSNGATTAQITNLGEGSFQVTVTDATGRSIVRSGEVRSIGRAPATPVITVVNSGPLCAGSPVSLTAFSGGAVEGYYWFDQAGGLVFVGSTFSINELAGNASYNVEARLSGCVSERAAINLEPKAPDASFQVDLSTVLLGEQVRFIPADTSLQEYRWTFGDGSSSTARFPVHSYGREGIYDVSLSVMDRDGCQQTKNRVGLVRALERSSVGANAKTSPVLCDADNTGSVTLQAVGGVPPYRYQWSNGSTEQQLTGLSAGVYTFTITDSRGARRMDSVRIENLNALIPVPQVEVNGNRPVCAGSSVMLLASNPAYPSASVRWYSDADSDQAQNNSKLLPLGLIERDTVLFLQADVNGCLSERRSVTVRVQRPEASFSVEPRRQLKEGDLVQFKPAMERADHQYYWSFGDGGWSRAMKPFYFYNVAGNFDVMLRVTDGDGCSNVVQQSGFIQVEPAKSGFAGTEGGAVEIRSTRSARLGAFPNPFSEQLTIVFQTSEAGEYQLVLRDLMGRALWNQQVDAQANQIEQITLETTPAQLPEGLYLISVETMGGEVKAVNKVLKTSH